MTPGYFFSQHSYSENAFFYKKVIRKLPEGTLDDYPVSLVLQKDEAVFYFHGYQEEIQEASDNFWQYYGVSKMFVLPLSKDSQQEAEQLFINTVKSDKNQELSRDSNGNYLFDESIYKKEKNHLLDTLAYSKLEQLKRATGKPEILFAHEILLDFLFDFFHSNVFVNHPRYTFLRARLLENTCVRAIYLKSEHYYYRNLLLGEPESIGVKKTTIEKKSEHATKSWLSFLRSAEGDSMVKTDNLWFDDVETEHNAVYKKDSRKLLKKESEDSVQWLLSRYDLLGAFKLQFGRIFSWPSRILIGLGAVAFFAWWLLAEWHFCNNHWLSLHPNAPWIWGLIGLTMLFLAVPAGVFMERVGLLILVLIKPFRIRLVFKWLISTNQWEKIPNLADFLLSLPKIVRFFKPKILLASFSVWAFLLTTDYVWDLDERMLSGHWGVIVLFLLCTGLLLATKFNQLLPMADKWKRAGNIFLRSVLILIMATVYSFIFGLSGMSLVAKSKLAKEGNLTKYFKDEKILTRLDSLGKQRLATIQGQGHNQSGQDSLILEKLDVIQRSLQPMDKDIYDKVLEDFYHDEAMQHPVFFKGDMSVNLGFVKLEWKLQGLTDVLIFLTLIAASLGVILEVGIFTYKS